MFPFNRLIETLFKEGDIQFAWLMPGKVPSLLVREPTYGTKAVRLETDVVTAEDTWRCLDELLGWCTSDTAAIEKRLAGEGAACIRIDEWPVSFVVEPLEDGYAIMILRDANGSGGDGAAPPESPNLARR